MKKEVLFVKICHFIAKVLNVSYLVVTDSKFGWSYNVDDLFMARMNHAINKQAAESGFKMVTN